MARTWAQRVRKGQVVARVESASSLQIYAIRPPSAAW